MAKFMKQGDVIEMAVTYFPSFLRSRAQAQMLGAWVDGTQYQYSEDNLDPDEVGYGRAFSPTQHETSREYENLRSLSPNNFAGLIVTTMSQLAIMEGISRPGIVGKLPSWETFRRNRWGSRQSAIHRGALGQSTAYGVVLPGIDPITGSKMSKMLGKSAERMAAFYDDSDDEWARLAIEAEERYEGSAELGFFQSGWTVRIYDAYVVHQLICKGNGLTANDWEYVSHENHGMPVPPVARCTNRLNLDGHAMGEIEPVLPILRRIDQDLFDRLINQRFGAWQVRYIAGMAKPEKEADAKAEALKLTVKDILISTDSQTKFGTLPAGDIKNQIEATDADLRLLSAISQLPPHHLLGLSSNLQAEALAAATEGLQRRSAEFRGGAGEFHEQMARLCAMSEGDMVTAAAWDLRVRWRDTESASMSQASQALATFAQQLGVPLEMVWERIPGWDDDDVQRAKELVEDGSIEKLLNELVQGEGGNSDDVDDAQ